MTRYTEIPLFIQGKLNETKDILPQLKDLKPPKFKSKQPFTRRLPNQNLS